MTNGYIRRRMPDGTPLTVDPRTGSDLEREAKETLRAERKSRMSFPGFATLALAIGSLIGITAHYSERRSEPTCGWEVYALAREERLYDTPNATTACTGLTGLVNRARVHELGGREFVRFYQARPGEQGLRPSEILDVKAWYLDGITDPGEIVDMLDEHYQEKNPSGDLQATR